MYTTRAREGINRLSNILTRMSEATRLEQTLQHELPIDFDLDEVVSGCVNGYQIAHPEQQLLLEIRNTSETNHIRINGAPDLVAQLPGHRHRAKRSSIVVIPPMFTFGHLTPLS